MTGYVKVCSVEDIPVGQMRPFTVEHDHIVICHTDDGFFALADECSHDSAPISSGLVKGCEIVCPRHGARFNAADGAATGPPAVVGIDSYSLIIENGDVLVRLP